METSASAQPKTLAIILPCYNEEEVLPLTLPRIKALCRQLRESHAVEPCVLLVDDGSADHTWTLIEQAATAESFVYGLKLAHNVGHQHALWAGMEWASSRADAAVTIDADLQEDEQAIALMLDDYLAGADIVYGVRKEHAGYNFFKRTTSKAFYRLMQAGGADVMHNHADFRLLSRRAMQALLAYPERNLFVRGMVRQLGLPSAVVQYNQAPRAAGTSKYSFSKMLGLAIDGITSFTVRPLRLMFYLGLIFVLVAIAIIVYALCARWSGHTITGWTSLITSIWFVGGSVLMGLSIVGEYIGKIYIEVKHRPRYLIEKEVGPQ